MPIKTKKKDPRIDAYIRKAAPFARPILTRVRRLMHSALPDVEETLRWGHPTFMHKGLLGGFAAFKQHATLGFWKHALLVKQLPKVDGKGMGEAPRHGDCVDGRGQVEKLEVREPMR